MRRSIRLLVDYITITVSSEGITMMVVNQHAMAPLSSLNFEEPRVCRLTREIGHAPAAEDRADRRPVRGLDREGEVCLLGPAVVRGGAGLGMRAGADAIYGAISSTTDFAFHYCCSRDARGGSSRRGWVLWIAFGYAAPDQVHAHPDGRNLVHSADNHNYRVRISSADSMGPFKALEVVVYRLDASRGANMDYICISAFHILD
jgi:hypothetical protein